MLISLFGMESKYSLDSVGAVIFRYHLVHVVGIHITLKTNSFDYFLP
jgi:hypothetical protein